MYVKKYSKGVLYLSLFRQSGLRTLQDGLRYDDILPKSGFVRPYSRVRTGEDVSLLLPVDGSGNPYPTMVRPVVPRRQPVSAVLLLRYSPQSGGPVTPYQFSLVLLEDISGPLSRQ